MMNERIKELAKQASQFGEYVNYGQIRLSSEQFEQKFAELIVKDLYDDLGKMKWVGSDSGWDLAIDAVRKHLVEHFGVEE